MKNFMNYDFDIQQIVFAGYVVGKYGTDVHTNRPCHGIAFHISGEKEYVFSDNKRFIVRPYDIIYLPKGSTYYVETITPGDCYAINFDLYENAVFSAFTIHAKNPNAYTLYFRNARTALEQKKQGYLMKCKAELYNIIYSLKQEYFSDHIPKSKMNIIKAGVDHIHTCYTREHITIEGLAKMCNITPEYFRKIFKQFYGVSPLEYLNTLKISRAKELLESGMYTVTEAALQSGYSDTSHFSREFKKATGVCPSRYTENQ